MNALKAERIEFAVDAAATAAFAGAIAWSLMMVSGSIASAAGGFGLALFSCGRVLRGIGDGHAPFDLPGAGARNGVQALLAEADRLSSEVAPPYCDELVLDDVLAGLGPDCRVVRLFDPAAMPAAAEFERDHDRRPVGQSGTVSADDSQALHDALAELRRSLR